MARDLLYKPKPQVVLDDDEGDKKAAKKKGAKDLGTVGDVQTHVKSGAAAKGGPAAKTPAYQSAYFTQDVSAVRQANLGASDARAMRGSEGASDLRKVVLPPPIGVDSSPEPGVLMQACKQMGVDGEHEGDLESILGRQGAWAQEKGRTIEDIERRQAQLEDMIAARKAALNRLNGLAAAETAPTLVAAQDKQSGGAKGGGEAADGGDGEPDVVAESSALVNDTATRAEGMHYRVAKTLGIKRPKPE